MKEKQTNRGFLSYLFFLITCLFCQHVFGAETRTINDYVTLKNIDVINQAEKLLPAPEGVAGEGSDLGYAATIDGSTAFIAAPGALGTGVLFQMEFIGGKWEQTRVVKPEDNRLRQFGRSLELSGNRLVVGATMNKTYIDVVVSLELINGYWTETQIITPTDVRRFNGFGDSLSISNQRLLIGAGSDSISVSGSMEGSAYVFELINDTWVEVQKITASDGGINDRFGSDVDIKDDLIVIGALGDSNEGDFTGSAYIFEYEAGIWIEKQKLLASNPRSGDFYGSSVAIGTEWLMVGAYQSFGSSHTSGAVYAYSKDSLVWEEKQILIPAEAGIHDDFGFSIELFDSRVVIGDIGHGPSNVSSGAAYVFDLVDEYWQQNSQIKPADLSYRDRFGFAVAASSTHTLITAHDSTFTGDQRGAAYFFENISQEFRQTSKLGDIGAAYDNYGESVNVFGNWAVVGSPGDDDNGINSGAVYVYFKNQGIWNFHQKLTSINAGQYQRLGTRVDLYEGRLVVSTQPVFQISNGLVVIYELVGNTWIEVHSISPSDSDGGLFGSSIDQWNDRIIIANEWDDGNSLDEGSVYVFDYDGIKWVESQKLIASDASQRDNFGADVAATEDLIVVGSPGVNESTGAVYVFEQHEDAWVESKKLIVKNSNNRDNFGNAVAADNQNILVGAYLTQGNEQGSGAVYHFKKINGIWSEKEKFYPDNGRTADAFGRIMSYSEGKLLIGFSFDEGLERNYTYLYQYVDDHWQPEKILLNDEYVYYGLGDISLSDSSAFVSSPYDSERGTASGSAYAFQVGGNLTFGEAINVNVFNQPGILLLAFMMFFSGAWYFRSYITG